MVVLIKCYWFVSQGKTIWGGNALVSSKKFPASVEVRLPWKGSDLLLYGNHHTANVQWVATIVVEWYSIKWMVAPTFDHAFLAKCNFHLLVFIILHISIFWFDFPFESKMSGCRVVILPRQTNLSKLFSSSSFFLICLSLWRHLFLGHEVSIPIAVETGKQ